MALRVRRMAHRQGAVAATAKLRRSQPLTLKRVELPPEARQRCSCVDCGIGFGSTDSRYNRSDPCVRPTAVQSRSSGRGTRRPSGPWLRSERDDFGTKSSPRLPTGADSDNSQTRRPHIPAYLVDLDPLRLVHSQSQAGSASPYRQVIAPPLRMRLVCLRLPNRPLAARATAFTHSRAVFLPR